MASRKIASAGAITARSRSFSASSASSSQSQLNTYKNGLAVNKNSSRSGPRSSPAAKTVRPLLSTSCASRTAASMGSLLLLIRDFLLQPGSTRSMVCRSARISSVEMVSMSLGGSTAPSTWLTSGSRNTRVTWQIASASRMWDRKALPMPSPLLAPRTMPAMSTKLTVAGTIRAESKRLASTGSRGSGTPTTPMLGSIVANG